jgi:hypothetical protein
MASTRRIAFIALLASLCCASALAQQTVAKPDRTVLPLAEPKRPTYTELDARTVKPPAPVEVKAPKGAPNVVIVLIDDMGFGVPSSFGGPVPMPTLDNLAQNGLRYNNFHTTALCSPTRAALKSGRNHHTVNMGFITEMATSASPAPPADPQRHGSAGRNAAPQRLQHGGLRQVARDRPGKPVSPAPSTAGRRARASTSSTASSAAKPTSGRPSSTTAMPRSNCRTTRTTTS